jgi:nucleoside-diphosphate-sugar epimerase
LIESKKIRVFVTGINSELMRRLVNKMPLDKFEIFGLSRKNILIPNVTIVSGDLQNVENWENALKDIDLIIHAAAITHSYDASEYFRINTEATEKFILLAVKNKVKQFVFISSRTANLASGAYGASKYLAEQFLIKNHSNYIIFRPSEIFGGQKGEGIDQLISDAKTKRIIACPVGIDNKLWPIFLDDTVALIYAYLFNRNTFCETITLNGPEGFTLKEIVNLTALISKRKVFILPIPKIILLFIRVILETLKLKIGPKPDQISRLYSEKEVQKLNFNFKSLENYLKESVKK